MITTIVPSNLYVSNSLRDIYPTIAVFAEANGITVIEAIRMIPLVLIIPGKPSSRRRNHSLYTLSPLALDLIRDMRDSIGEPNAITNQYVAISGIGITHWYEILQYITPNVEVEIINTPKDLYPEEKSLIIKISLLLEPRGKVMCVANRDFRENIAILIEELEKGGSRAKILQKIQELSQYTDQLFFDNIISTLSLKYPLLNNLLSSGDIHSTDIVV